MEFLGMLGKALAGYSQILNENAGISSVFKCIFIFNVRTYTCIPMTLNWVEKTCFWVQTQNRAETGLDIHDKFLPECNCIDAFDSFVILGTCCFWAQWFPFSFPFCRFGGLSFLGDVRAGALSHMLFVFWKGFHLDGWSIYRIASNLCGFPGI